MYPARPVKKSMWITVRSMENIIGIDLVSPNIGPVADGVNYTIIFSKDCSRFL